MKRILTRSALTVLFLTSLTFPAHSKMDGEYPETAFTHIGMVHNDDDYKNAYFYFNLGGNIIQTYVQDDGSVIVLRDYGATIGPLQALSTWNAAADGRFILPSDALAELDGITRLRLSTAGPGVNTANSVLKLDAVTTNMAMIQKVQDNETLHRGTMDNVANDDWANPDPLVDTNASYLTGNAKASTAWGVTLRENVFHARGAANSTVFTPSEGHQVIKWINSDVKDELTTAAQFYSLSVLADLVAIPDATGSGADYDKLVVTKIASPDSVIGSGHTITYSYVITNNTADMITDISMSDIHGGEGAFTQPDIETGTITTDAGVIGDSYDLLDDGVWDGLAPGDTLTVTAPYTVVPDDVPED